MTTQTTQETALLSLFLKENTTSTHESLDKRIMSLNPFSALDRYTQFIRTQARLQQITSSWYQNAELQALFPDLSERDRFNAVQQDCRDLGLSAEAMSVDQEAATQIQVSNNYEALGWLYTVEGSNIGAAILLKHAKESLGLSETHGARHLTGHGDGRGVYWRRFKEALDSLNLSEYQRMQALKGAREAFTFTRNSVEELLAPMVENIA